MKTTIKYFFFATIFTLLLSFGNSFAQEKSDSTSSKSMQKHTHNMKEHHMKMHDKNMKEHQMETDDKNTGEEMKTGSDVDSHNHKMDMKDKHISKSDEKEIQTNVRKGVIDLREIDKNSDGKVYQDVMDFNVISDEAGTCPICGMKLKEVSLETAKENLLKNGFKVKEK